MGRIWSMNAVVKNAFTLRYRNIRTLDESLFVEDLLYIGKNDGLIQVSGDGGKMEEDREISRCA
ncbi:MAG: hypothetical protein JRI72_11430 [Deltaproteobacteria bacterium]|nr:hypothetical protein [Deltaproteobacteria bacterium]